jgi:hypothetical protein
MKQKLAPVPRHDQALLVPWLVRIVGVLDDGYLVAGPVVADLELEGVVEAALEHFGHGSEHEWLPRPPRVVGVYQRCRLGRLLVGCDVGSCG